MIPHPEVDAYISSQSLNVQEIMRACRQLLFALDVREMRESIKWNIPFYEYRGLFCFLNPTKKGEVVLGFCQGAKLKDEAGLFVEGNQKTIRHVLLSEPEEAYREEVVLLLQEALNWNEANGK